MNTSIRWLRTATATLALVAACGAAQAGILDPGFEDISAATPWSYFDNASATLDGSPVVFNGISVSAFEGSNFGFMSTGTLGGTFSGNGSGTIFQIFSSDQNATPVTEMAFRLMTNTLTNNQDTFEISFFMNDNSTQVLSFAATTLDSGWQRFAIPNGAQDVFFDLLGSGNAQTFVALDAVAAVPEPETYALMLAGLGMIGLVARRRSVA